MLNRRELINLSNEVKQNGYSIVPTKMYAKNSLIKLEIALAKGKKSHDKRADIKDKEWIIYDASVYKSGVSKKYNVLKLKSNFDYKKIQNLFSNLSTLSLIELFKLRENYKSLNYSTVETDIQINKIFSYPIYLTLMTILSSIIMFNTRNFKNTSFKIAIGLFLSVIIYYINNFFNVMGSTEKLPLLVSIWTPIIFLSLVNLLMLVNINEK